MAQLNLTAKGAGHTKEAMLGKMGVVRMEKMLCGGVYFIQGDEDSPIKIGYSGDVAARHYALQSGNPSLLRVLAVQEGGLDLEGNLQSLFADLWVRGEWFTATKELLGYVEEIGAGMGLLETTLVNTSRPSVGRLVGDLARLRSQLEEARSCLQDSRAKLYKSWADLRQSRRESQRELPKSRRELRESEAKLRESQAKLQNCRGLLEQSQIQLQDSRFLLAEAKLKNASLESEAQGCRVAKRPTVLKNRWKATPAQLAACEDQEKATLGMALMFVWRKYCAEGRFHAMVGWGLDQILRYVATCSQG